MRNHSHESCRRGVGEYPAAVASVLCAATARGEPSHRVGNPSARDDEERAFPREQRSVTAGFAAQSMVGVARASESPDARPTLAFRASMFAVILRTAVLGKAFME